MKTITISTEDYIKIAARDESHFFDIKEFAVSGKSVQKIAAALSNADGGEFIIGIKDKGSGLPPNNRWEGIKDIEQFNGHLQALFDVKPALDVQYAFLQRDGVQVTEGKEIVSFLADYSPKTDALEFCLNQNLLDFKTWQPRTVAALLFHPAPSAVIPKKCAVKITRYETKEDDPERDHLAEQATIEGPAYQLIHSAVARVTEMMSSIEVWSTEGLKKIEYPPEALWETIVNAVLHRDYSISDDIQILVFDNRIEILSPGKLPGYVNISNILDARFSRNAKLVRTLNRYRDAPNKDLGEGLNTTFQKMKEFGLKDPIISEEGNYVKVVLPHLPLAVPTVAIMDFLRQHDQITNRQARDLTGIRSENSVKTEFYKLRDEGHIERVPGLSGNKSAWQLTAKGKAYLNV